VVQIMEGSTICCLRLRLPQLRSFWGRIRFIVGYTNFCLDVAEIEGTS
jgi:hypothetical protein